MTLFLSSLPPNYEQLITLAQVVGRDAGVTKVALIENASDIYAEEKKRSWAYEDRNNFQAFGFDVDIVDLEDYRLGKKGLLERLNEADIIWLTGGNVYYLRWILRQTRADIMIVGLVNQGKIYGGDSAGAVIAGPTLSHFQSVDDPSKAPEVILDGLALTNTVAIPHWDNEKYATEIKAIADSLVDDGYKIKPLEDGNNFIVSNH